VSLFGAAFSGVGRGVLTAKLAIAGSWFASTSGYRLEVVNAGVSGDLAYLVGFEHRTIDAAGAGVPHTLRVTFIYRREASQWKLIHRHSDVASTDVTRAQGESRLTSERDVLARTRRRG
jgi:hypothetical protein